MRAVKQSTARTIMVLLVSSTDHIAGVTGATLTITASKAGAAFASITPTVTERGSGWYSLALTTAHLDTLGDFALHVTASGADPSDVLLEVVAYDPADAVALGLSRIDAAISSRSTYAGGDTSGTTTILGRILGTLAAGTHAPQTGDAYVRLGAPVTASHSTDVAAVKADTAAVKLKTDNLPASPAAVGSQMTLADDAITAAKIAAGAIGSSEAPLLANLDAAMSTRLATAGYTAPDNTGIGEANAHAHAIDTRLPTDPADESSIQAAIATRAATGAAMTLTSGAVDAILDDVIEGTTTLRQALRVIISALVGKVSGAPTGPIIFRDIGDTKARITATVDANGNRTAVTTDAT